jgi:hypothetical protein
MIRSHWPAAGVIAVVTHRGTAPREGGRILVAGLATGVAGTLGLGRLLEAQLFGVRAADPTVLTLAAIAFGACGLLAVMWPARHAAATDALKEW